LEEIRKLDGRLSLISKLRERNKHEVDQLQCVQWLHGLYYYRKLLPKIDPRNPVSPSITNLSEPPVPVDPTKLLSLAARPRKEPQNERRVED